MRSQWNDGASATPPEFGPIAQRSNKRFSVSYLYSVHAAWPSVMGIAFRVKIGQLAYVEQPLQKIPDEFRPPMGVQLVRRPRKEVP
jgi:hypothetical protein